MKVSITKKFEFEAAHKLPDHPGKCKNLHGHSYRLEVTVSSDKLNDQGMVMDFGDLKVIVNEHVINTLDHTYLNDFFPNPTAEIMTEWIWLTLDVFITEIEKRRVQLKCIRLYETSNSYAEIVG